MQVKKFEAPTMKEALEMVKVQLGPDAIILAARDHRSSFGLMNKGSVEVTAAVSELTLKKRQVAESRLPDRERDSFRTKSARAQKDFIERAVGRRPAHTLQNDLNFQEETNARSPRHESHITNSNSMAQRTKARPPQAPVLPSARARYIDIPDEHEAAERAARRPRTVGKSVKNLLDDFDTESVELAVPSNVSKEKAEERVRSATQSALRASEALSYDRATTVKAKSKPVVNEDVSLLKREIEQLQDVIRQLKSTPPPPTITLHPGADFGVPFELSAAYDKLTQAGLSSQYVVPLLDDVRKQMDPVQIKKKPLVEAWLARHILDRISICPKPSDGRIHLFVGPNGQGKTSTLIKMASHLVIKEKRHVAILTTDTAKVGACDQLRIYAQILNVPFGVIRQRDDWNVVLDQLTQYDAILVDFPGGSLRSMEEIDRLRAVLPPASVARTTHYVLSATARDTDAMEVARRYQMCEFQDVIFTSLDESTSHGIIYNFQQNFGTPLHSFGTGPLIPEDYEWATRERVIDLIFKISKLRTTERGSV